MKIYLCFMCGPGSLVDLKELIEPVRSAFDGVVAVLHDSRGSDEDAYLESIKGAGAVIHLPWSRRHAFARNHYLWAGPVQEGDWIVQCDVLERINPQFAANLRHFISGLEPQGINAVFYYNKAFIYQQHESLEFAGSPHEGLRRHDGQMHAIELSTYYPTETDVRYSVRASRRTDPYHWVSHYAQYLMYPMSNHGLLGLGDRGDVNTLWPIRERNRLAFIDEMKRRGFARTLEGLNALFAGPLDERLRALINSDKVWQDYYRYHVLGDLEVRDEHLWTSMKTV